MFTISAIEFGEHVMCVTGSTEPNAPMCAGDQCCAGTDATNTMTYACPSAHPDFKCAFESGVDHVRCVAETPLPLCSGNQCCPGRSVTNGLPYACPNADAGFLCPYEISEARLSAGLPAHVECVAGTGSPMCVGNQCCRGTAATNGMDFACSSADDDFKCPFENAS